MKYELMVIFKDCYTVEVEANSKEEAEKIIDNKIEMGELECTPGLNLKTYESYWDVNYGFTRKI